MAEKILIGLLESNLDVFPHKELVQKVSAVESANSEPTGVGGWLNEVL